MTHTPFQLRRDTAADWTTNNPVLREGELGLEVDGSGDLDGAKVGNGTDAWAALGYVFGGKSGAGWETYTHSVDQSLAADTRTKLEIDGSTSIVTQSPADVSALWDTASDTITGRNGDAILVKVQCEFTPDDGVASHVDFDVDIGGAVGVVEYQRYAVASGSGVSMPISWTFAAYTLDTWEVNGGTIYAEADGPGVISDLRIVITRTHKARS